jgi:hypothetical protein
MRERFVKTALAQNAKIRIRIAFFCLFVFIVALSVGAYYLSKLQDNIAAQESRTALQGITDPTQIDEALRQHPSNKFLKMIAMATKASLETSAAAEQLSNEVEPPAISKNINFGKTSRSDLEALRRDLKTAETNATALVPRTMTLTKAERDKVENYALSLHVDKHTLGGFMDVVDKRLAKTTVFTSEVSSARAEYYRAYEKYVAVLVGEFGAYKVVNGEFRFPFQPATDRYNAAAAALTAAAKRVAEIEEERKQLMQSQHEGWEQFVNGND